MKKLLLVSKGRYGTTTEIVEPSSVQDLTKDIIRIADGFHCDFDEVKGYVYDDSDYDSEYYPDEDVYAVECNSYESMNLLYTGHNCDDGLTYREETDDFIDENGDVFKTQDDAYEAYTREDFGGDIADLFNAFNKKNFIIWSNEGYMEFDGTCKENIASDDLYKTFSSKEEAEKYIEELKSYDDDYGWEWLNSLKVEEAWF